MKQKWLHYWYIWQLSWQQYQSTLLYLHRADELEHLADWAKRKKLGVFHYYKRLLYEAEDHLDTKSLRYPMIFKWALFAYQLNKTFSPEPQYYSKGYAAKYRLNMR